LFVVDIVKEKVAVTESRLRGVPIVAIVDSNGDPEEADFVIPANDDAVRSLKYIISRVADAYGEGKSARDKSAIAANQTKAQAPESKKQAAPLKK
jgi:small subunit ribosomal protein S2